MKSISRLLSKPISNKQATRLQPNNNKALKTKPTSTKTTHEKAKIWSFKKKPVTQKKINTKIANIIKAVTYINRSDSKTTTKKQLISYKLNDVVYDDEEFDNSNKKAILYKGNDQYI